MKNDIRKKAIRMSNMAILSAALVMTSCFTGCAGKDGKDDNSSNTEVNNEAKKPAYEEVNNDNLQSFKTVVLGNSEGYVKQFNPHIFDLKYTEKQIKDACVGLGGSIINYGANKLYMNQDGELVTIDNGQAMKLIEKSEGVYGIGKTETFDGGYTLINENGEVTIVFSDSEALKSFVDSVENKLNAEETKGIINGFQVVEGLKCEEVELLEGTENFYNIDVVITNLNTYLKLLGEPFQEIKLEVSKKEVVITRTAYEEVDGELTTRDISIAFPIGEKGGSYFDNAYNIILGYTYEDGDNIMMSETAFRELLGIDITNSSFVIPSTETTVEDVYNISAGGNTNIMVEKEVVLVDSKEFEEQYGYEVGDYNMNYDPYDPEEPVAVVEEAVDEAYDNSLNGVLSDKYKTSISITSSDPAEQAQQLVDQLRDAYPDVPWIGGNGACSVSIAYADYVNWNSTEEECNAAVTEYLGGRNIFDLNPSELMGIVEYTAGYYDILDAIAEFDYSFSYGSASGGGHRH